MSSRRNTLRRPLRLRLSFGRRLPALTADVSRGGFCAETPETFMPGSKVHGSFLVGDTQVPFRGTVAWAEAGHPQLSVLGRLGVTFDALPKPVAALLADHDRRPRKLKPRVKR